MPFKQMVMSSAAKLLKTTIQIVGGKRSTLISAWLAEELVPTLSQETDFGVINFFCPGKLPEYRASTWLTKEPETIEWINTFNDNDVLWDIGANVGCYSLYAALRNLRVLSFEPSPSNYYLLNRNIEINKMDDRISALCMAFNDVTLLDSLYMTDTKLGGALNSFGEAVDWRGKPYTALFKQAMIGFSIDDFVKKFNPLFPNHIKIDVDGIENKIIKGARNTLSDRRVKSILVELDSTRGSYFNEVIAEIEKAGMRRLKREHAPMVDDSEFSTSFNHIFCRISS